MAPNKKSKVWNYFEKLDDKTAKCKLCQKTIRSAGNTTNLMGHIKNMHKAVNLEIQKESNSGLLSQITPSKGKEDVIESARSSKSNILDPKPSTSNTIYAAPALPADQTIDIDYDAGIAGSAASPKRPKIQKSIKNSFEEIISYTSTTGEKARKINNAILFMICRDNQPFSVVENEGFQNLLKVTANHYKMPSRSTVTRWLDDKYNVLSTLLKSKLSSVEYLTLTSDIWSDMQMRSFLGVTAHFGLGTEFQSVTLGVYQLDERHTSEYIAENLIKTCNDWGVDSDKVSAVVTDNAANMVKAVEIAFGKKKHIPCFAHTLNLVAQNILQIPELQNILLKIKSIVTFFKQSCVASDELRKSVKAETKLIQDVPTRWNSTYYMIQRFLELKSTVSDILICHKTAPPMLTGLELNIASSLLNILRPLEAATKEISGDKYCTGSKVIPLVRCMLSKLKTFTTDEPLVMEVQKLVLKEINKRMGAIEQVSSLAIATIFDPRFKKLHFEDPLACSNAVQKIKEMMKNNLFEEKNNLESDSDGSDKVLEDFSLWSDHHKLVHRNWKSNKSEESVSDELSVYLRTPVSRLKENPLEVWADYKQQFPKLYKIAYKYLTLVASSVPSERLFSKASQVLTQQRNRIQGKRVNKILFLQSLDRKYWDT